MLYNNTFMYNGNTYFNRFNTPIEHLLDIFSVCFLQFRLVSQVNPRKCYSSTLSIYTSSILSLRVCIRLLGMWKTIYLVLLLCKNNVLIFIHSLILQSSHLLLFSWGSRVDEKAWLTQERRPVSLTVMSVTLMTRWYENWSRLYTRRRCLSN